MLNKILPGACPSCGTQLRVRRMACPACDTSVEGDFDLPVLARIDPGDQEFILNLLKAGGSLKELASLYGISYPTVRNRLDALIEKVKELSQLETRNTEQ